MTVISLPVRPLPAVAEELRAQVRGFLQRTEFTPQVDSWIYGYDREFSRALGAAEFLGMTWPKQYGGHERSAFERFVVIEELVAAGAPVAGHWIADRQFGPSLLNNGTEEQKQAFLPLIAAGELYTAAGLSEPDAGSDLANVATRGTRVEGGWRLNGQKIWTSGAHLSGVVVVLARTAERTENRHAGMTQFLVELPAEGVTIRPITQYMGAADFNEIFFDDVFVPDSRVLGAVGEGWTQATSELSYERSGAERFLSPLPLIRELESTDEPSTDQTVVEAVARVRLLRSNSIAVAGLLDEGAQPIIEAALIKDVGTDFEQRTVHNALRTSSAVPNPQSKDALARYLAQGVLRSPTFTLRGGVNDILRGIIAKAVGLR